MWENKHKETETQPQCGIDMIKMLNVRSIYRQCVSDLFHVWCKQKTVLLFLFKQSALPIWKSHGCVKYLQYF